MSKTDQKPVSIQAVAVMKTPGGVALDTSQFEVKRRITVPTLSFKAGCVIAFRIDGEAFEGKAIKGDAKSARGPATLVSVTDLTDGIEKQLILPAIIRNELTGQDDEPSENYPNGSYVGRFFMARNNGKRADKDYVDVDFAEIEEPPAWPLNAIS